MSATIQASDLNTALLSIRRAAADVYLFTDKLSWLKRVHQVAVKAMNAVEAMQQDIDHSPDLQATLAASNNVSFFDAIVDEDVISELEEEILSMTQAFDDPILSQFLTEVVEKTETKYKVLIKKTHDFNALMKKISLTGL